MTLFKKASRLIFFTLLAAVISGCAEQSSFETLSEEEDPVFRRARDLYSRGMENEALENFLKLIQKRNGNAPESHLDAGNIYLKHLRDPISAIYHFKRYEALVSRSDDPEDQQRLSLVKDRIKTATKEFAMTFDAKVYQDPLERLKLMDTIKALRSENEVLKEQLTAARDRLNAGVDTSVAYRSEPAGTTSSPAVAERRPLVVERRPEPAAESGRTYVIQSGDSLYKISRTVYGDGSRWREILDANRDKLPTEQTPLKVGERLRIP